MGNSYPERSFAVVENGDYVIFYRAGEEFILDGIRLDPYFRR